MFSYNMDRTKETNFKVPQPAFITQFNNRNNRAMSSKSSIISSTSSRNDFMFSNNPPPAPSSIYSSVSQSAASTSSVQVATEVDRRLKLLSQITSPEEFAHLSRDLINQLNAKCFDKISEQWMPGNSTATTSNRQPGYADHLFSAAQKVAHKNTNTNRLSDNSPKIQSFVTEDPQQVSTFSTGENGSRISEKNNYRPRPRVTQSKPKKPLTVDLNITRDSLRSRSRSSSQLNVISPRKKQRVPYSKTKRLPDTTMDDVLNSLDKEIVNQAPVDESINSIISNRPKRTALSPFVNQVRRGQFNTSTPRK